MDSKIPPIVTNGVNWTDPTKFKIWKGRLSELWLVDLASDIEIFQTFPTWTAARRYVWTILKIMPQ